MFIVRRGFFEWLTILWLAAGTVSADTWDITDTGQPYKDVAFTLQEGTWMSVDVHPDGQFLVFDLLGDIYRLPITGGEATLIKGGPAMDRMPRFSADGNSLLYISDKSGEDNVWITSLDGSNSRQVTYESVDVVSNPAWEPSGNYIAATKLSSQYSDLFTSELRLYHINGGSGQPLVESPHAFQNVTQAQFSADGQYLYYTQKVGGPNGQGVFIDANHTVHAIMQRNMETGKTTELLKGFGGATTAQVSPDSQRIAFVRRVKDKTVLFVYDLNSGEQRPVYDQLDRDMQGEWIAQGTYYPQYDWFPDGRHIAIWGQGKLYKVDTQTASATEIPFRVTAKHRITEATRFTQQLEPETLTVKAIRHLALSADQQSMVFNALGRLWYKTLPAGQPKRLTDSQAFEFEPVFSPDGKSLAYVEWDDEQGSTLKLLTLDGSKSKSLLKDRGVIRQPVFSANGKMLAYQIQEDSKCMGGFGNASGIYTLSLSHNSKPLLVTKLGVNPQFSPNSKRLYYLLDDVDNNIAVTKLISVNLQGQDSRTHAVMPVAERSELRLSPNGKWLGFKEQQNYYVMPLADAGGAMKVSASEAVTPVTQLSKVGGYNLTWAGDSSTIYWMLGEVLHSLNINSKQYGSPILTGLKVKSDVPEGTIAFTGARLITITNGVIEDGTLLVRNNRIAAVGSRLDIAIPKGAKVIDSRGKTIMPGLVNMHGHVDSCYYQSTGATPQKQASLYASLAYGITTNFDPYSSELPSYAASEMQLSGDRVSPRTITVGSVIYGRPGKSDPVYTPVNNITDANNIMLRKKALGGSTIKSYRQPQRRQRQQLVKAARESEVMVSIEGESHFYNNISAILDGHNTIEHNLPVANYYDDVIQLFSHSQTANTPTLVATFGEIMGENFIYQTSRPWEDPRIDSFVPEVTSGYSPLGIQYAAPLYARAMTSLHAADELWDIGFKAVARSTKKLDDAGVLVNVGSHSQVQGLAMHWEMQLMAEGGMSAERVLRAATLNGAKTLGLDNDIGSLTVGKLADLIVLEKNPLENILNSKTVVQVMIGGRLYDSYSMNEIGNYNRPRARFYWESGDDKGTGWNKASQGQ
ncbi:amidohydrolase family protein [Dasania sp. GY-MA-18]|uniref:Amidohydrolase family protein n=1 Tax=Dasania phycosphaerae TaxID=2950436 RepID=A0A9J6RIT5_9GAMM|nr:MULTISPECIES: amidohydrolase family protein [Dasania]MCR8921845.1 amidohydrolase family protein [Dasania sp. GY-MA-18]MCZ0864273.1 amidohydrolase family protein [Dasania phycosphaerae]MCZ0868001.1 amidohydrolase family protein [Dasania phycosphaerae]